MSENDERVYSAEDTTGFMTIGPAAKALGLSVSGVRCMAQDGRLPFTTTLTGVMLFPAKAVFRMAELETERERERGRIVAELRAKFDARKNALA